MVGGIKSALKYRDATLGQRVQMAIEEHQTQWGYTHVRFGAPIGTAYCAVSTQGVPCQVGKCRVQLKCHYPSREAIYRLGGSIDWGRNLRSANLGQGVLMGTEKSQWGG